MDYNLAIEEISTHLIGAKKLIGNKKTDKSVSFIPAGHHFLTGLLKSAGYRILKNSKTIFLVGKGKGNKISVFDGKYDVFMGKKWKVNKSAFDILKNFKNISYEKELFDWCDVEFAFLRVISEYDEVVCMEIGDKFSKKIAIELLSQLVQIGNIVFISDMHSGFDYDDCVNLDTFVFDDGNLSKEPDLFLLDIFEKFSISLGYESDMLGYINSGELLGVKKDTTGFGCFMFG